MSTSAAAARLRAFLEWRGWSQTDLAEATGYHQASISKLIAGTRGPGLDIAHQIERLTGEPDAAGKRWPDGPIRTEEWLIDSNAEHVGSVRSGSPKLPRSAAR